jgi:histidinol phosphatase-like PHP family hydrolase
MYDLHTHTTFSDGELIPAELLRRAAVLGYHTLAISDHVDWSSIDFVLTSIAKMRGTASQYGIHLLVGVELTHIPPADIAILARYAKEHGADIVVVHGESPVEPVASGTNTAACSCPDVDVLAHPGFLTPSQAESAVRYDVWIELTARSGHNRTNGYVARVAEEAGATLVLNSDAHAPHDLMDAKTREIVVLGSGVSSAASKEILCRDLCKFGV